MGASPDERLSVRSSGACGTGQVAVLAPSPDHMADLSFPNMLLSCLWAEMLPEHLLSAVWSSFTWSSVSVLLKMPVLHQTTLRVLALN